MSQKIRTMLVACGLMLVMLPLGSIANAQALKVVSGSPSSELNVPMNGAVVVESDRPFVELSIANPEIADISTLSDRSIYVLGKKTGSTTLTLLGANGSKITNVDVRVGPDLAEFKQRLRQILPAEKIEVRTANDGIVLSGMVSSISSQQHALDLAERYAPKAVLNLMSVGGTQQVMLKVRFAEMGRTARKALSSALSFTSTDVTGASGTSLSGASGAMSVALSSGGVSMSILLEALESKGVLRTLSEPNLTALSGQEAAFLAGGEYPVPVASDTDTITVEYKPFGVELSFVPVVLGDGLINLSLKAAVSSIDSVVGTSSTGLTVNSFSRRETSTTVELHDGESFAIAGLIQDEFYDAASSVPWLGDIPVLGALFRSASFQREQSELVIIITAHLVSPTRGEALALPTDRIRPPTEKELFLHGKTVSGNRPTQGAAGEVAQQDFSGSYGYVMEN